MALGEKMARTAVAVVMAMGLIATACGGEDEPAAGSDTTAVETTAAIETTAAPEETSVETTIGGDTGGVTLDEIGRLVPAECTGEDNVAREDEGVTVDRVNLSAVNIDLAPVADLGFSASDVDMSRMSSVFVDEVNDKGGVCGRQIDLQQVLFNTILGATAIGAACVQVTDDRPNLAAFSGNYQDPLCITDGGVPFLDGANVTEAEMEETNGLLFSRYPSVEAQYRATAKYAIDSGALEGTVGVWYGDSETELGDVVENVVLPMLDEAGVDYTAVRTDFMGSYDPQGNAVLNAGATEFAARGIDTLLAFVNNMNIADMQLELDAQGLNPRYISMPIAANTAIEVFAEQMGTREISDGMEYLGFTYSASEVDNDDPIARSCNEVWTRRTGEVLEPNTFDFMILSAMCVMVDEVVAAISLAGGDLSRDSFVEAMASLPAHPTPGWLADMVWSHDYRFSPAVFAVEDYDGATNTVKTREDFFEV